MIKKGSLLFPMSDSFLGFDVEWTKNYQIKNGNVPFCFSIVAVDKKDITFERLEAGCLQFSYVQYYCQKTQEAYDLIADCDMYAKSVISSLESCILCGHQVSSDFSVLLNYGRVLNLTKLNNIAALQCMWHERKKSEIRQIVDTRYDVEQVFMGNSRRLVDMCNDFLMDVTQPELHGTSMTKLQNVFYTLGDSAFYERIAVMNLRHSLCAVLLYWLNCMTSRGHKVRPLNINKTVYYNLKNDFAWVNTNAFGELL